MDREVPGHVRPTTTEKEIAVELGVCKIPDAQVGALGSADDGEEPLGTEVDLGRAVCF